MDTKNGTIELFAQVVVAKNVQKDEPIFFDVTPTTPPRVIPRRVCLVNIDGDSIVAIENIIFDFDRKEDVTVNLNGSVGVEIRFDLVFLVKDAEGDRAVRVVPGTFTKNIPLDEFCPSLTIAELAEEVEKAEVLVRNVRFDVVLRRNETCTIPGGNGTPADVLVFADIIVKLTRFTDVIVVGELDSLEKEC